MQRFIKPKSGNVRGWYYETDVLLQHDGGAKVGSHYNARLDYCNALSVKLLYIAMRRRAFIMVRLTARSFIHSHLKHHDAAAAAAVVATMTTKPPRLQ